MPKPQSSSDAGSGPGPVPQSTDEREAMRARFAGDDARTLELAVAAARALYDARCSDVIALDVRGRSDITDAIVIATGTSERQMAAAIDDVREAAKELDTSAFSVADDPGSGWIVADFLQVMVHVFEPNTRAHYDLEMLWGDAPRLAWERPGDRPMMHRDADEPPDTDPQTHADD